MHRIHVWLCKCKCIYIHMYIYIYIHTLYTSIHILYTLYTCINIYIYNRGTTYVYVCMYIYIYIRIYVYILYIHLYTMHIIHTKFRNANIGYVAASLRFNVMSFTKPAWLISLDGWRNVLDARWRLFNTHVLLLLLLMMMMMMVMMMMMMMVMMMMMMGIYIYGESYLSMIVIFWFMMAGTCIPELGGLWKLGYHWQPAVMHFVSETSRCKAQDQDLTVSRK